MHFDGMRPEPGGRAPAPGPLRLVQRFVNSVDLEDGPDDFDTAGGLGEWLVHAGLHPVLSDGASRLEPTAAGVDAALGHIVAAVHAAIAEDTWPRLKACERDVCRWAFYDHSKNRSGHWCSMAGCGSREKNRRAYRRRRASRGSG